MTNATQALTAVLNRPLRHEGSATLVVVGRQVWGWDAAGITSLDAKTLRARVVAALLLC